MKLKEVINNINEEDIIDELIKSYPLKNIKSCLTKYKKSLRDLKSTNISNLKDSTLRLLVLDVFSVFDDSEQTDVLIYDELKEQDYRVYLINWNELLNLEIYPKSLKQYGEVKLVAHCLYEITAYGFKEENKKTIDEVVKEIEDIKDVDFDSKKPDDFDRLIKEINYEKEMKDFKEKMTITILKNKEKINSMIS